MEAPGLHRKSSCTTCLVLLSPARLVAVLMVLLFITPHPCRSQTKPASLDVRDYGAHCDWSNSGQTGTDDTSAFQAAANAATASYGATGAPVEVRIPNGCKIGGSVVYGSGVHWKGPGSIIVPMQYPVPVLAAQNADDVSVEDITVTVINHVTQCSIVNDSRCVAITYQTTNSDAGVAHKKVSFVANTVYNSNWGILVTNQSGNDTVSDIHVDRNTVISTTPYTYHDGIHVAGGVSLFTISNNNVYGRGDAAISVSSEVNGGYVCSGGVISGNTVLEDLVGVDDSGCSNVVITGNIVRATTPISNVSNPAFRSIYYDGGVPSGLTVNGNTFVNYAGTNDDYSAKFDLIGSATSNLSSSSFTGNTIGSLYTRGSRIAIQGNTFLDGAKWNCDVDFINGIPTDSILFGQNAWLGTGTANCAGQASLITNDYFLRQLSVGNKLTLNIGSMIQP